MTTAHVFTKLTTSLASKLVSESDSFRVLLATSATTGLAAAQSTVQFMSDVKAVAGWAEVANSAGGSNYVQSANSSASGQALAGVTWTQSGLAIVMAATNPAWVNAGAGFAPAYAVFFDASPGSDAANPALCWWDFGGAQPGIGVGWTLFTSGGILTATVS
jgi:hypothetical protein